MRGKPSVTIAAEPGKGMLAHFRTEPLDPTEEMLSLLGREKRQLAGDNHRIVEAPEYVVSFAINDLHELAKMGKNFGKFQIAFGEDAPASTKTFADKVTDEFSAFVAPE
ncbi:hypothetical protein D3C71_1319800 [compost metagenome]